MQQEYLFDCGLPPYPIAFCLWNKKSTNGLCIQYIEPPSCGQPSIYNT